MKLKKKVRRTLIIILLLIILGIVGFLAYKYYSPKKEIKEVKIINQIDKYGYSLKENKPSQYKKLFEELKEILNEEQLDEEKYVKKITEMFINDFYSLNDKTAKTDVGGVDFVYSEITDNFLENAQNTYYKYIESNIYNNRKQTLPIVDEVTITNVEKTNFTYGDKNDENTYVVSATWTYTDTKFASYQKAAKLVFIHDGEKLSLVELQ